MNYFSIGVMNIIVGLSILIFPFICFVEVVEASPTGKVSREVTKKSVSCPGGVRLICPTSKEHFVVHYSYSRSRRRCELGSILHTALKKCDNSIMQYCMDGWVSQNDNCSASIFKKVVDSLFRGACSLHDLCYLSLNTKRDECDDWFLHNMKQICNEKSFFKRIACKAAAHIVYGAVRGFGGFFYGEKKWALDNCIPKDSEPESSGSAKGLSESGLSEIGISGSGGSGMEDLKKGDPEVVPPKSYLA